MRPDETEIRLTFTYKSPTESYLPIGHSRTEIHLNRSRRDRKNCFNNTAGLKTIAVS
jgi:hypothetical protein